jgi:hypothetical protein
MYFLPHQLPAKKIYGLLILKFSYVSNGLHLLCYFPYFHFSNLALVILK